MSARHFARLCFLSLITGVLIFTLYFSLYTVKRYQKGYAHYFDLGIMHQTVYNTFKSLKNGDVERFLELTDPHQSTAQVKRMSVHNDILLAVIAPAYFFNPQPETLLILQAAAGAAGAWLVFFISVEVLKRYKYKEFYSCLLAFSYLLYPPLQRAITFEFHAVIFAIPLILMMHYAWIRRYGKIALICGVLALTAKEQVGFTVAGWAGLMMYRELSANGKAGVSFYQQLKRDVVMVLHDERLLTLVFLALIALSWTVLSFLVIIPAYRGDGHFANSYYSYLGNGVFAFAEGLFRDINLRLIAKLLLPVGLLSLLSPLVLVAAAGEWAVILLSLNENMQNIYFHYHAVLVPFIFIAAGEGVDFLFKKTIVKKQKWVVGVVLTAAMVTGSYLWSALPWSAHPDMYPWKGIFVYARDVTQWQRRLHDDTIPVASSGRLAPFFSGRRYFYDFSPDYDKAQYIILDLHDVSNGYHSEHMKPAYTRLLKDWRYVPVYQHDEFVVYRRTRV